MSKRAKQALIEYHKRELEQLTSKKWEQKAHSAGDDTKWGTEGTPADLEQNPPKAGPPPVGYEEQAARLNEAMKKFHTGKESQDENKLADIIAARVTDELMQAMGVGKYSPYNAHIPSLRLHEDYATTSITFDTEPFMSKCFTGDIATSHI